MFSATLKKYLRGDNFAELEFAVLGLNTEIKPAKLSK